MRVWLDGAGREWEVALTVAAARRALSLAGVDLLWAFTGGRERAAGYLEDMAAVGETLAAVCRPQASARGLGAGAFLSLLRGDVYGAAAEALLAEVADFFPEPPPGGSPPAAPPDAAEVWAAVDRAAGVAGVDPGPLTLRQLAGMAEGRERAEWGRHSVLLALVRNAAMGQDDEPVTPDQMNPHADQGGRVPEKEKVVKVPLRSLKGVWVKGGGR